jgi:hypothetical protein
LSNCIAFIKKQLSIEKILIENYNVKTELGILSKDLTINILTRKIPLNSIMIEEIKNENPSFTEITNNYFRSGNFPNRAKEISNKEN